MTKALQNIERFPFGDIELIPKPNSNPFRHGWLKWVKQKPAIVYRGEYPDAVEIAGTPRRRPDAHLFWAHRGPPAAVHRTLAQTVCRLVSRRRCRGKKGHSRLRPEAEGTFPRRAAGPPARLRVARGTAAQHLVVLGKVADQSHQRSAPRSFPSFAATRPSMAAGASCRPAGWFKKRRGDFALCVCHFQKEYPNAELVIAGKGPLQPPHGRAGGRTRDRESRSISAGSFPKKSCSIFTAARIVFFTRAKRRPTKTRKEFRTRSWKRWRPGSRFWLPTRWNS